jgi:hypothetical protein
VQSPVPITLETAGVKTYAELYGLPTPEVVKRLDDKQVPLHPGDAFLAVMVLRAVAELRESAERLDAGGEHFRVAGQRLQRAGVALAVVAVAVAVVQLVASLN